MPYIRTLALFVVAGLAEIGGGWLVWKWLRDGKSLWLGLLGGVILFAYGVIPTLQKGTGLWPGLCRLWRHLYYSLNRLGAGVRWLAAGSVRPDRRWHSACGSGNHHLGPQLVLEPTRLSPAASDRKSVV